MPGTMATDGGGKHTPHTAIATALRRQSFYGRSIFFSVCKRNQFE